MAVTTKTRCPFGDVLREALNEQGVSVKELARRRAATTGGRVENERRSLVRYVSGDVCPSAPVRDELADLLGVERERFAVDEDQEAARRRLLSALMPLADVLLQLATETGAQSKQRVA